MSGNSAGQGREWFATGTGTSATGTGQSHPFAENGSGHRVTCPGQGRPPAHGRLEPLSATRYRIEFTASAELHEKIERARELVSHSVPTGELSTLFERALDLLIQRETTRKVGAGRPRKERPTGRGSRHVPVTVARSVWERDGAQCTFLDEEGRRCSERRFLTIEHRQPFARGGPPTVENLCLLCASHNQHRAREVFGESATGSRTGRRPNGKRGPRNPAGTSCGSGDTETSETARPSEPEGEQLAERQKVLSALCNLGFRRRQAMLAIDAAASKPIGPGLEPLLRAALEALTRARW